MTRPQLPYPVRKGHTTEPGTHTSPPHSPSEGTLHLGEAVPGNRHWQTAGTWKNSPLFVNVASYRKTVYALKSDSHAGLRPILLRVGLIVVAPLPPLPGRATRACHWR